MGLSVNTFTYAGVDEFDLSFALGYASVQDVTCYTDDGTTVVDLDFDWLSDSKVRLETGHGLVAGDEIVFRRTVTKQQLPVDLTAPGAATRENLELIALHVMYAMHELLDDRTDETHPWTLVGEADAFTELLNLDYLTLYTEARDE